MKLVVLASLVLASHLLFAQEYQMNLWEGDPPGYVRPEEKEVSDSSDIVLIRNIDVPDMEVYLPTKRNATGQAVVICPGGGYYVLAYDWEGTDMAKWFNSQGIAAIVVKYRAPAGKGGAESHKWPLMDVKRAVRLTRHHAVKWNIDPDNVGVMGFSAGGHLVSTLGNRFDSGNPDSTDPVEKLSSRPDFMILMYPVISFVKEFSHEGSGRGLVGEDRDPELLTYYSNELHVRGNTPPAFIVHAQDDDAVPVENSIVYYEALNEKGIPVEMHLYPKGGHGFAFGSDFEQVAGWTDICIDWMKTFKK